MKEQLLFFGLYLVFSFIFVLMVLRAIYFTFVLKKEPLRSLNVIPKIKWKTKKGSLLEKIEKEKKAERLSKWG